MDFSSIVVTFIVTGHVFLWVVLPIIAILKKQKIEFAKSSEDAFEHDPHVYSPTFSDLPINFHYDLDH